jgi:hypothetical protein
MTRDFCLFKYVLFSNHLKILYALFGNEIEITNIYTPPVVLGLYVWVNLDIFHPCERATIETLTV